MNKNFTEIEFSNYLDNYLTKKKFVTIDILKESENNLKRYLGSLIEAQDDKFDVVFEELRSIREYNERRIEICENRLDRVENRLGVN